MRKQTAWALVVFGLLAGSVAWAQTNGQPEEFEALTIVNNNVATGAGRVLIRVTRWSSEAERTRLVQALTEKGPSKLLDVLSDSKSVGTIRTPDSLGYDLRYAYQERAPDGGRRIVIATNRPIGFWEATNRPRTIDYPFTVIQMQIGREGKGTGTMSYATKITSRANVIELENFATAPAMLTEITAKLLH